MKKIYRFVLYILGATCILVFCLSYRFETQISTGPANELAVAFITQDDYIVQELEINCVEISNVAIRFATYQNDENNEGLIHVKMTSIDDNQILFEEDITIEKIKDNQFYYIPVTNKKKSKSKKYYLEITGKEVSKKTTLAIYGYETDDNKLVINDTINSKAISVICNCTRRNKSLLIYLAFYILIIGLVECIKYYK